MMERLTSYEIYNFWGGKDGEKNTLNIITFCIRVCKYTLSE